MKVCPTCKTVYAGGEVFCPVDAARLSTPSQMIAAPDPQDPLVGSTLNSRYKIVRRIGEGGMGIVYEAQHVVIEKRVALKVLRNDFSSRPDVVERFRQEAKSASRIGHENIVDISDFGETPSGQSYFVMEFLEGADLADVLARDTCLAAPRATDVVIQCCRALGAAHAKGIVHRDMKPENIFVTRRDGGTRDFIKIVDFGIAKMSDIETPGSPGRKLTKTGMIFGTPEYMSPEQAGGKSLDHRVDIYALGVILYELISGRVPFVGDTFMGILTQHMFEEVPSLRTINPNVTVSPALEAVVHRALAKDPDRRFQTMDEMAREITRALNASTEVPQAEGTFSGYGEPVVTRTPRSRLMSPTSIEQAEFPSQPRKSPKVVIVVAAAVAVLVLGAGAYAMLRPRTTDELDPVGSIPVGGTIGTRSGHSADAGEAIVMAGNQLPRVPSGTADASGQAGQGAADMVQLTVETRPSGANIAIEGRGAVCARTPCSFETKRGEVVRIQARRGRASAERELIPSQAMTIEMLLLETRRRPPEKGDRPSGGEKVRSGDLKIPDIFQSSH